MTPKLIKAEDLEVGHVYIRILNKDLNNPDVEPEWFLAHRLGTRAGLVDTRDYFQITSVTTGNVWAVIGPQAGPERPSWGECFLDVTSEFTKLISED